MLQPKKIGLKLGMKERELWMMRDEMQHREVEMTEAESETYRLHAFCV